MSVERIRVAALQYYIRPVSSFDQFRDQVEGLVDSAADYQVQLLAFPEYFTLQLLTLGNVKRPIQEQVWDLATQEARYVELMSSLARRSGMYIVGGTLPRLDEGTRVVHNDSLVFSPGGGVGVQGKLHMTRFEHEEWGISPRSDVRVFECAFGLVAVAICYDVEFPEVVRAVARSGAHVLVVPSCTDDRQGYLRVRYCSQARAVENQQYVVVACTVGSLPMVPAVSLNYGQAAILTPSDFPFSRDGILAEGSANQEMMIVGELNLKTIADSHASGTVLPLYDSHRSAQLASRVERVTL